jgi:DNA mismatch repair protein MutL
MTAEQYVREYVLQNDADRRAFDEKLKNNPDIDERVQRNIDKAVESIFGKKVETVSNNKQSDAESAAPVTVEQIKQNAPEVEIPTRHYRIVGETFNSYIVVELDDKMLIIDKHAAHERIIFEQLKRNMYASEVASQLLMLPIEIMLMSDEVDVIEEYRAEIEAVGFEFTVGKYAISVTAIPEGIDSDGVVDMILVMAERIKSGTGSAGLTKDIIFEKALYQASCKAAIKAGREYSKEQIKRIVDKLMEIPDITVCPHGRPVAMILDKKNLDRQFERT